jgi:hypothetical protein
MGAAESKDGDAKKKDGSFKPEEIILCCSDTGQHGKFPTGKTGKKNLPQNFVQEYRSVETQTFSPRAGSAYSNNESRPISKKFDFPVSVKQPTQPEYDYIHFAEAGSPHNHHAAGGQSAVDVYRNFDRNFDKSENPYAYNAEKIGVGNHPYTHNSDQIPPGFCSFQGVPSRQMKSRFTPDPNIGTNKGYQDRLQIQPHEMQQVRNSKMFASDDEIWQEYNRESSRLKAEHQMLQARVFYWFFHSSPLILPFFQSPQDQLAGKLLVT